MPEKPIIPWERASLLALSMTALGHAIQIAEGRLLVHVNWTIFWLSLCIVTAAMSLFTSPVRIGRGGFRFVVVCCLLANFAQLMSAVPTTELFQRTASQMQPFTVGIVIIVLLSGLILASAGPERIAAFVALLLTMAFAGHWIIDVVPNPHIDVYVFQLDASAALADGHNPYTLTFPNIYAPQTWVYGDGVVKNGRLQFGYPYLPESLLAIMPAVLLNGDLRYAHLAAVILSAILIVAIKPDALGFSAALLFLTTPRLFMVLTYSWIEPFTILTLAATIACSVRWPKLLPVALGLFLASKQYVPIVVVLFFAQSRPMRETIALLLKAGVVALIVTLPMALWNFSAFWQSTMVLQFRQPFRFDALSYLAWMGQNFWPKKAIVLIPFAAMFSGMAIVIWRRRFVGFAGGVAFCFLLFFAFNKQAFANYYFFVIGAMACGMAELATHPIVRETEARDAIAAV